MKILGLDISSATIGLSLIDYDQLSQNTKLISVTHLKPKKTGTIFERLIQTEKDILEYLNLWQPDRIVMEDILLFNKKSTMKTLILLGVFNRLTGLICSKWLKESKPILLNVNTVRAILRKIASRQEIEKSDIPDILSQYFGLDFPAIKIKKGKKKDQIAPETYDQADATAVAVAYVEKFLKPQTTKKKTKKG